MGACDAGNQFNGKRRKALFDRGLERFGFIEGSQEAEDDGAGLKLLQIVSSWTVDANQYVGGLQQLAAF